MRFFDGRESRRQKLLATPFPAAWLSYVERNVALYRVLTHAEQAKLRDLLRVFIAEKTWEGCSGFTITDEVQVTIAAQACVLLLGFDRYLFEELHTVLVYPGGFLTLEEDVLHHEVQPSED